MSFPESDEPPYENTNNESSAQKEQILKQILSPEARLRLNNIKMVKSELSDLVEQYLIGMATQGKYLIINSSKFCFLFSNQNVILR